MAARSHDVRVERVPLPTDLRAASRLARIDYSDAHRLTGAGPVDVTAERWMREMLEQSAPWFRYGAPVGWVLLGLERGPRRAPENVLGWPVAENSVDRVVVGARSRTGMPGELMLHRDGTEWVFATVLQFDNAAMRTLWHAIAAPHRLILRYLMRTAAGRLATEPLVTR